MAKADAAPSESQKEEILPSQALSAEDEYYYKRLYKEPVESMVRIEETAKILIGAAATVSGLLLAAFKLASGDDATVPLLAIAPTFLCWAASIVLLVLALAPQEYEAGQNEPASIKQAFIEARSRKFKRLSWGVVLFVIGVLYGAIPFFAL